METQQHEIPIGPVPVDDPHHGTADALAWGRIPVYKNANGRLIKPAGTYDLLDSDGMICRAMLRDDGVFMRGVEGEPGLFEESRDGGLTWSRAEGDRLPIDQVPVDLLRPRVSRAAIDYNKST